MRVPTQTKLINMELRGTLKTLSLRIAILLYLTFSVVATSEMFLEPGVFKMDVKLQATASESGAVPDGLYDYIMMEKSMYANSEIAIEVLNCSSDPKQCDFTLEWSVRQSDCDGVYRALFAGLNETAETRTMEAIYNDPDCIRMSEEHIISYIKSVDVKPNPPILCSGDTHDTHDKLNDLKGNSWECSSRAGIKPCKKPTGNCPKLEDKKSSKPDDDDGNKAHPSPAPSSDQRKKRADEGASPPKDNQENTNGENVNQDNQENTNGENVNQDNQENTNGENVNQENQENNNRENENQDNQENTNGENVNQDNQENTNGENVNQNNPVEDTTKAQNETYMLKNRVVHTNEKDGRFLFIIYVTSENSKQMNISLRVRMKSPHGYLSATQYPLLPFYGIMCAMYSILGLIWIVLLFRQWKDLLRIQFWISVVIILGLIEKAAFVAEYERHNNSGSNTSAGIFFAEELSVLKRTMARMLVIIVSLGYGITRPRLGRDLNWLLGAGILFFLLSSIEAYFRIFEPYKTNDLIALLPLSVLDAVLCWWIFRSLVDTSRTLRLRRNLVKLWLYRHFTNALIFCVVAAVVFLVWSLKAHKMNSCVKNWNEIWVDDAYWHILFCVILIVIMILFRPTANNQRYAYSVLSDAVEDDESKEPMMNDAFESVKMRNVHSNKTTNQPKEVDDLQWVEDNIPAAVADAALGAFDDSEEELITNVERNKME